MTDFCMEDNSAHVVALEKALADAIAECVEHNAEYRTREDMLNYWRSLLRTGATSDRRTDH